MGRKNFVIKLEKARISVYIKTEKGLVIQFVIKLEIFVDEKWEETCRYDDYHGSPHKDILDINGATIRKIFFNTLTKKQAVEVAIKDFKENYKLYAKRYLKWKKE